MTRLIIIGGGGHGAVIAETAAETGRWPDIIFLDDDPSESRVLGFLVAGHVNELSDILDANTEILVAVGDNERRLEFLEKAQSIGGTIATLIHPTAWVSGSAKISAGTAVCAGAIINTRVRIGSGCIINTGSIIDHDCILGNGVHVSPGANLAGDVRVGNCAWVGIGASVREEINIGRNAIIGAGAAVISDVRVGETVVGVPARLLRATG